MGVANTVETLMTSAQTSLASSDYASAKNYAQQAWALLLAMPNAGRASSSLSWDRTAIKEFIAEMDRNLSSIADSDGVVRPVREDIVYGPEVQ